MNDVQITDLPRETFAEILIRTDGYALGRCRRVCSTWKEFIDETDYIWQKMCIKDFKCASKIAKRKSGNDCKWYYIYRNLRCWCDLSSYSKNIKEFYKFNSHSKLHSLDMDYGVLPLKDTKGIVLYDTSTLKYIPITLPERDCIKIANNDHVTVIMLLKCVILIQRTIDSPNHITEAVFKADNFTLTDDFIYYYKKRDVFKCNIKNQKLSPEFIIKCDYDIEDIQHNDGVTLLFTKCRKFVNIAQNNTYMVVPLNCPNEWLPQIKNMCLFNDKNFVCYSRNLFKLETEICSHLYFHFPHITALFFYGDIVLIGTKTGEILLYKLLENKKASQPIFHTLLKLPDEKFALKIDVCERKTGPIIIVTTFLELYTIDMNFYPNEEHKIKNFITYSKNKLDMYKRLLKIKERLERFQL